MATAKPKPTPAARRKPAATKEVAVRKTSATSRVRSKTAVIAKEVLVKAREDLATFSERSLKVYGEYVVEQRAIPDFRDGLKPVHRYVLWAAYNMPNDRFVKSARIVGDTIGKYHPHGDASCYGALVGLTGTKDANNNWGTRNCCEPLIEGYGAFGDFIDSAAAYRYTEARLSEFSKNYLLDPDYLAVTDFIANYSETDKMPLVLPAKLPTLLLNGSFSVAFGVSADMPAFERAGVVKAVKLALAKNTTDIKTKYFVDAKELSKHLVPTYTYGGTYVGDRKQLYEFLNLGKGALTFMPSYEISGKNIVITSACPDLNSIGKIETLLEKIKSIQGITRVEQASDKRGIRYEAEVSRSTSGAAFDTVVEQIMKLITKTVKYEYGITERYLVKNDSGSNGSRAKFRRTNVPKLLQAWCAWRVELESKVIANKIAIAQNKLRRQELLLIAVNAIDIIVASLKVADSEAFLVKKLKITLDEANEILEFRVRQLKKLEAVRINKAISEIKAVIATLVKESKNPEARIVASL